MLMFEDSHTLHYPPQKRNSMCHFAVFLTACTLGTFLTASSAYLGLVCAYDLVPFKTVFIHIVLHS
jgi:hypothetical protein